MPTLEDNVKSALADLIWTQLALKTQLEQSELQRKTQAAELEKLRAPAEPPATL